MQQSRRTLCPKSKGIFFPYRHPLLWIDLDHSPEQILTVRRDEVRDVELPLFDLLQQLSEVVVVEGQRAHQKRVKDHAA